MCRSLQSKLVLPLGKFTTLHPQPIEFFQGIPWSGDTNASSTSKIHNTGDPKYKVPVAPRPLNPFTWGPQGIEVDVTFGGSCNEHKFELNLGMCIETFPVQCKAELIDLTQDDGCAALRSEAVLISLQEAGLNDRYYSRA